LERYKLEVEAEIGKVAVRSKDRNYKFDIEESENWKL